MKPSFDEQLQTLREQLEELQKSAEKELKKAARDLDLESGKSIKMESNSSTGFNFRYVQRTARVLLRLKLKFYIILYLTKKTH